MRRAADAVPDASVVICSYSLERWADLEAAVSSARNQSETAPTGARPADLILVIDHNDELLARARARWPDVTVVANDEARGLSGARNTGVRAATGGVVAFLDDDARAASGWLRELVGPFRGAHVVGSGGYAEACWDAGRPRWFPPEFDWVVGCSYRGLPEAAAQIRNPLGCNMAFRRDAILAAGSFRSGIGRLGRLPIGGEETELGIRLRRRDPDAAIIYVPTARVRHRVPADRGTWRYFRSRCYQEGRSKAHIAGLVGSGAALASERSYATRALPAGVLRGLGDLVRGDPAGLLRAAAIIAGLAITTIGYAAGRIGLDALAADASSAKGSSAERSGVG